MAEFANWIELEKWLKFKNRETCLVLATRIGLRTLPLLGALRPKVSSVDRDELILASFRCLYIAFFSIEGSDHPAARGYADPDMLAEEKVYLDTFENAAASAVNGVSPEIRASYREFVESYTTTLAKHSVVGQAARRASKSECFKIHSVTGKSTSRAAATCRAAARAVATTWGASDVVNASQTSAAAAQASDGAGEVMWDALLVDASALENADGSPEAALMQKNLWPDIHGLPDWIQARWDKLKGRLTSDHADDWDFWIDWYEARVRNAPLDYDLACAVAMMDTTIWDRGAATVNAEIRQLTS